MIKPINRDIFILSKKSLPASASDLPTAADLLDTLKANSERCVGMAANMIGVNKRIIAFNDEGEYVLMLNPEIIAKKDPYVTEEGCLSLDGVRSTKRYKTVKVKWQTTDFKTRIKTFSGFSSEIIQHEVDHLDGILI